MLTAPNPCDPAELRAAYGTFPTGVTAVCALRDGAPVGFAASTFVPVSLDPPLVSVCVQHTSTTWPLLADRERIGLSVLADTQGTACRQLASKSGDRFAGVSVTTTGDGAVLLDEAAAWLDCSIHQILPAGDHDLVLLKVEAMRVYPGVPPLVFHASGFRSLAVPAA
ncbi:flavin reductase family protein [Streptomyces acidicola]|uniref:Flavin reductase family protein n=1 Tax=Streptomyces acidicola TaxID=2596892 RepID=A0A5N8WMH6_9ACTN|nr:flavin reductase family protein [Streptomyces acidicola]MPY47435.1 flavin reductase family protein [Streptomyces acidicola]